jgi:hypothetical protein
MHRIAQGLVVPFAKIRAVLVWLGRRIDLAARWRRYAASLFDLALASLLCLLVAALAGLILALLAWLHGAPGGALRDWFLAGFLLGLLAIALMFLWDRRA